MKAQRVAYPEANVMYADALFEHGTRQSHLSQSFDGFWLQSICTAGGCLVCAVVEDLHVYTKAYQVGSMAIVLASSLPLIFKIYHYEQWQAIT